MNDSPIEWCDNTWNPIVGCRKRCGATPRHPEGWCYARRLMKRRKPGVRPDGTAYGCQECYDFTPHLHPERLDQPARLKSPRIIFAGSVTDLFGPGVKPHGREQIWAAMNDAWWHHYVILTKRPDLIDPGELDELCHGPMKGELYDGGVWLGVSVTCDDDWWRVERLLEVASALPGLHPIISFEPLLGPIEHPVPPEIGWVIVGAQSGPGATAPDDRWVRKLSRGAEPDIAVFEKHNLDELMPRRLWQRWPEPMVLETGGKANRG